jgi:hypothetical protein
VKQDATPQPHAWNFAGRDGLLEFIVGLGVVHQNYVVAQVERMTFGKTFDTTQENRIPAARRRDRPSLPQNLQTVNSAFHYKFLTVLLTVF